MHFGLLEILTLVGSVCLFLYGMKLMSEGLQKAAGDRLRHVLSLMTSNRFVGALTGILITALVQSSSATTVMIVSFVNAGLLSLGQSIAVIFGANVGTTLTAWIISLFGFKMNIASFAIPLIGVGVPLLFLKKNVYKSWGEFFIGFALLFLGLEYLNAAVPDLRSNPGIFETLQNYSNLGYWSILIFTFFGIIITVVVQASSAMFAIALIMCSKGWVPFELACALVLGGNIGTCITPLLASISGNVWARRAALAHLLYNLLNPIWLLIFFSPFVDMIDWMTSRLVGNPEELYSFVKENPELVDQITKKTLDASVAENEAIIANFASMQYIVSFGLSLFHTVYNIFSFVIMIWFTKFYAYAVTKLAASKPTEEDQEESHLTFISAGMLSTAELSILQARKEIILYSQRTQRMLKQVWDLYGEKDDSEFVKRFSRIQKYENISDRMEVEIATYLTKVADGRLSDESKRGIQLQLRVISEIESIADSCYNLARTIQHRRDEKIAFTESLDANAKLMFNLVDTAVSQMITALESPSLQIADVNRTQNLENEINNLRNQLKTQNILDVNDNKYPYSTSVIYMDMVVECEKLGDYVVNVVEALADSKLYKVAQMH